MSSADAKVAEAELERGDETRPAARLTPNDLVTGVIRLIQRRRYQPGERLREQELADHFGVSRGRVREALRILEAKSIIRVEPMRGATVARMSDAEVLESVEIAAALFGLAARQAAQRRSEREHRLITAAAAELTRLADGDVTPRAFFVQTVRAGQLVVDAAHGSRLPQLLVDVRAGWPNILGAIGFTSKALRRRAASKWVRMAQAIVARDAAAAERLAVAVHFDVLAEVRKVSP